MASGAGTPSFSTRAQAVVDSLRIRAYVRSASREGARRRRALDFGTCQALLRAAATSSRSQASYSDLT